MENENIDIIKTENKDKKTMSFYSLLKLKIENQNENASKGFTFFSLFLSVFNLLVINANFINIGVQSKILAQKTGNFWITLILLLPYIFMSVIAFVCSLLSKFKKEEFIGRLAVYLSYFVFAVMFFFLIFISAVF